MARSIDRRTFLKAAGTSTVALLGVPLLPSRSAAQSDKLVVAVGQWGIETPFAWRIEPVREDPLGLRLRLADHARSQDLQYRPGLATEWKPSNEMRTWTFKLRSGVQFHEGLGRDDRRGREVHRRAEPQAGLAGRLGALLPHQSRPDRDARQAHGRDALQEAPVGRAVAVHASSSATRTSPRRSTSSRWARRRRRCHPIGTGPYRHVEGKQGDFHRFEAVPNHWRKTPTSRSS